MAPAPTALELPAVAPELPSVDLRALARRAALPAALAALLVAALAIAGGPLEAFADALGRAMGAQPAWVAGAAAFELLSFAGYVALLWLVAGRATARMDLRASAYVTLGGAAATRLLPTGGAGGAALTFWSLRRAGLDGSEATRALLTFLVVLYSVFLAAIVLAGGALGLGLVESDGPSALAALPAVGAGAVVLASLALAARAGTATAPTGAPTSAASRAAGALRGLPGAFGLAVRDAIATLRGLDARLLGALAWWGFDAAVLWAMLNAFGAPPAIAVLALAYFVGQVANTLPIPGAASGGIVGVLLAFDVAPELAIVSVLAYRALAIWLPAAIGLAGLHGLRHTFTQWTEADRAVVLR